MPSAQNRVKVVGGDAVRRATALSLVRASCVCVSMCAAWAVRVGASAYVCCFTARLLSNAGPDAQTYLSIIRENFRAASGGADLPIYHRALAAARAGPT